MKIEICRRGKKYFNVTKGLFTIKKIEKPFHEIFTIKDTSIDSEESILHNVEQFESKVYHYIDILLCKPLNSFHSDFINFRKTLNFKRIIRKTKIDSVLKKCKSKFFRAIQEAVNQLIEIGAKINRLPQLFITNINIDYNKKYINKTIFEIFQEFELITTSKEDFFSNIFLNEEKEELLDHLLNLTYKEAFDSYLKSDRYTYDIQYIRQREGDKFAFLYVYVSKIFIKYYTCSKGNKSKKNDVFNDQTKTQASHKVVKFKKRLFGVEKK